jgi:hypothetical protein
VLSIRRTGTRAEERGRHGVSATRQETKVRTLMAEIKYFLLMFVAYPTQPMHVFELGTYSKTECDRVMMKMNDQLVGYAKKQWSAKDAYLSCVTEDIVQQIPAQKITRLPHG